MAEEIKKVVVENVPKVYGSGYTIRYRIVSEDRNRISHWSPMHTFERPQLEGTPVPVSGEIVFVSQRQVSASWQETNANSVYEIFLKWEGDPDYEDDALGWRYVRTISTPTYSTFVPNVIGTTTPAESVRIWVQQPTSTKERTFQALVYTGEDTFTS